MSRGSIWLGKVRVSIVSSRILLWSSITLCIAKNCIYIIVCLYRYIWQFDYDSCCKTSEEETTLVRLDKDKERGERVVVENGKRTRLGLG
jgi:hypothetical protein